MVDCLIKITKQEGLKALYSGICPAVLRQATYGTIKFGTYYTFKKIAVANGWRVVDEYGNERVIGNIVFAVTAGALSSAIANPTDVLKVRLQAHGRGANQGNMFKCFKEIYINEGIHGLWRVSHIKS